MLQGYEILIVVIDILLALLVGAWSMRLAEAKKRDAVFWAFLGGAGSLLGLLVLYLIPDRQSLRNPGRPRWYELSLVRTIMRIAASGAFVYATGFKAEYLNVDRTIIFPLYGIYVLIWAFVLGLVLVRWMLGFGGGILGVAKTTLEEAVRMRIALVFILMLLLTLPILPMLLDPAQPLSYRITIFLTYSLYLAALLLGGMTVFLACGTLSWEIEYKQIFSVVSKPIGRSSFLLGKWLGILMLNTILLGVTGLAIHGFTVFHLAKLLPNDRLDDLAVREQVLIARVTQKPAEPEGLDKFVEERLAKVVKESPELIEKVGGESAARRDIRAMAKLSYMSIGPGDRRLYTFTGLQDAAAHADTVQLRYNVGSVRNVERIMFNIVINGERLPVITPTNIAQFLPIKSSRFISDKGDLVITVENPQQNPSITFIDDNLEVLYPVDSFGPNFWRGIAVLWVRLAFLAMLGLMAATFLSFPVACMLAVIITAIAMFSPYLIESANMFGGGKDGISTLLYDVIRNFTYAIATTLSKFAEYSATDRVADGRLFGWSELGGAVLWIGGIWTGAAAAIAALVFSRRELARVQV